MIALMLALALGQQPTWPQTLTVRDVVPVHGTQQVGRRTVQLMRVSVAEPVDQVLAAFVKSFHDASLYVPPPHEQLQLYAGKTMLTAVDPRSLRTFTVTVWASATKGSEILSGESALSRLPAPVSPELVRLLPASSQGLFCARDEGTLTCTFSANAPVEEVKAAMAQKAAAMGAKFTAADGVWLISSAAARVSVTVKGDGARTRAVVIVQPGAAP